MSDTALIEHAKQFSEAVAGLIRLEGMKAANRQSEANGMGIKYTEVHFEQLLNEQDLSYNSLVEKSRRFY